MQMSRLFGLDLYVIVLGILVFLVSCAFVGMVIGFNFRGKPWAKEEGTDFIPTTILGLLALVLGFTYSMSVSRFEVRRDLSIQESTAISTAFISVDLIPETYQAPLKSLVRKYLDHRIEFYDIKTDLKRAKEFLDEERALKKDMWSVITEMNRHYSDDAKTVNVEAFTKMFEVSDELTFATVTRTPEPVYSIVFIIASVGIAALGFVVGLRGRKNMFGISILSVLFSIVIGLILDIDRPQRGIIDESDAPLVILKTRLDV